ncbi:hypothetical protein MRX96_016924 [Rhipicephalus microplus]
MNRLARRPQSPPASLELYKVRRHRSQMLHTGNQPRVNHSAIPQPVEHRRSTQENQVETHPRSCVRPQMRLIATTSAASLGAGSFKNSRCNEVEMRKVGGTSICTLVLDPTVVNHGPAQVSSIETRFCYAVCPCTNEATSTAS